MKPALSLENTAGDAEWRSLATTLGFDVEAAVWVLRRDHIDGRPEEWRLHFDKVEAVERLTGGKARHWSHALKRATVYMLTGTSERSPLDAHSVYERIGRARAFALWGLRQGIEHPEQVRPRDIERYLQAFAESYGRTSGRRPTARHLRSLMTAACAFVAYQPYGNGMLGPQVERLAKRISVDRSGRRRGRTPPEALVLELLHVAMRMIGPPADDVIRMRDKYKAGVFRLLHLSPSARRVAGRRALEGERFSLDNVTGRAWTDACPTRLHEVAKLLRVVQGACIYVIAFACAPRTSEIRAIQTDSVVSRVGPDGNRYSYLVGRLAKSRRLHEWVACAPVVRAIEVLGRISAPLAEITGRKAVLLGAKGSMLWSVHWNEANIGLVSPGGMNDKLVRFVAYASCADPNRPVPKITIRHGRRSFARFVTMRNKSSLGDLASHFGHASRAVTDQYYASGDGEYSRLIEEYSNDDAVSVLNEIAHSDSLFSNLSEAVEVEVRARCAATAARAMKEVDVKRMLGAGAALAPCDWGVCMYKQATSACNGGSTAPNEASRTPDVCAECLNFFVPPSWLPWWETRVADLERFARLAGLPEQSRRIIDARLQRARLIVQKATAR